ncbi:MAG: hypothetical protein JNJ99_10070, partial [Crocinitomicaceae bacterium]|nr:hypothetical protein [Crocinitomicaceae bacterium]
MKLRHFSVIPLFLFINISSYAQVQELYGIAPSGGVNNDGIIFKTDTSGNNHQIVFNFDNTDPGKAPWGGLLLADDGMYYGLTYLGGSNGYGTLFQYNPETKMYFNKFNFDNWIYGKYPVGGLIQASNGKLYGMAEQGGASGFNGVIFEYDPTNEVMTKLHDFDGANSGSNPRGNLFQASNGKLYGLTCYGGLHNKGVLFEYDIDTDVFIKKVDFDGAFMGNGA